MVSKPLQGAGASPSPAPRVKAAPWTLPYPTRCKGGARHDPSSAAGFG